MTKNSSLKKAARAFQRANPGVPFPAALAAVDHARPPAPARSWSHGQSPWIRSLPAETPTRCYLCGKTTSIVSFGDLRVDQGRVQMYCDHTDCDARETEIVIVDDGVTATAQRSDVRILAQFPPVTDRPEWTFGPGIGWAAGTSPHARVSGQRMPCLFCGEVSCVPAPTDPARDGGRLRLRCNNTGCAVIDDEVLVTRDGTGYAGDRPDVEALRALRPPRRRSARLTGPVEIVPVVDPYPPSDQTVLDRRRSGPLPWD